ncbi:Atu2307/SP_0267 family LLM class monooxygenase [Ketogulonicigenium vulgare]|uniref:Luciferase family protein n=1 Tax=Ketogulonicigenium vulgare (strain WSH-001) TaxID=759362 RepID=F9Y5N4_KETVW|nr:Atu2307/SP_0267 family LLM class monooxygenase [Ketogulonicigenium vulgare]ADO43690.1 putative oxidoreductase [Ketogulonicigenium vulgare Y25]AEM41959.1 Luciferase family protein [Ketogulonicigenium vulgare WSH-001]ALJ82060.1 luciferase [Ketogulonicigenium vulgare]ANW34687.1 luciferase [Ketogulonicigenium vulgare]AOZ55724.1 oxidoreductase [Ketogulonicigenium vulgare]
MAKQIEFGLDTFGDVTRLPGGKPTSHGQVLRELIAEGELAEQVGVDVFGVGEHHRADFAVSAIEPVLAALAVKTEKIKLASAVTVLSSDDPIRVYQRFSTVQALSNGRAEMILGRGSFTESFPLFGLDLSDYDKLFSEKLDLLSLLLKEEKVSWKGTIRPELKKVTVYPRPEAPIKTWIGVGGSPESVVRTASYNMPMLLAVIGGAASRFKPYVDLYKRAHDQFGTKPQPIGMHSPGHVGPTDAEAQEEYFEGYQKMHALIGKERGWPPLQKADFLREISHGSLYVGGPETVARKIADNVKALDLDRFTLKYSAGPQLFSTQMRGIELFGTKVIPLVRDMLA